MPATITAHEQNLVKVFSDDYLFDIPLYQRPYSWDKEHVDVLLDDLTDALNRDGEAPYFLGSVVLIKDDGDPESQVVDGQQRLTTLTMLLCVLRDISIENNTVLELDTFVRQAGGKLKGVEDRFRLSLRPLDRKFFQHHVQARGALENFLKSDTNNLSDSQKNMFINVNSLKQKLGALSEDKRNEFAKYIIQNCYLVVVSTSDTESAHRIFEVMNDRGLNLTATDILKSVVLSEITEESKQSQYAKKWESIEEELGRDNFRDLFAHIRMIYQKDKLRDTLQKAFQTHVLHDSRPGHELSLTIATEFVDTVLEPYADAYQIVSRASYESAEDAEKVNELLRHLNRLDNFDWMPPAISYFCREKGHTDNLIKFTRELERLAYGLFIRRANINERIGRYARILEAIEQDTELFHEGSDLQLSPEEKAEILRRLGGDIYDHLRVRMPLLLRLDSLLADEGVRHQPPVISIEHVLPQNPQSCSQWIEWFPDDDERSHWTHRLANLDSLVKTRFEEVPAI